MNLLRSKPSTCLALRESRSGMVSSYQTEKPKCHGEVMAAAHAVAEDEEEEEDDKEDIEFLDKDEPPRAGEDGS